MNIDHRMGTWVGMPLFFLNFMLTLQTRHTVCPAENISICLPPPPQVAKTTTAWRITRNKSLAITFVSSPSFSVIGGPRQCCLGIPRHWYCGIGNGGRVTFYLPSSYIHDSFLPPLFALHIQSMRNCILNEI